MTKTVTVKMVGGTDRHTNATAVENHTGSLSVLTSKRGVTNRKTYAAGRWTHVDEEGIQE